MSTGRPPPGNIPTLTEVVSWPATPEAVAPANASADPDPELPGAPEPASVPQEVVPLAVPRVPVDDAQLVQRVLADVEKQVDLMLEVRLREALAPVLARATDTLVRDARKELTSALRDVVVRAVARELGRPE